MNRSILRSSAVASAVIGCITLNALPAFATNLLTNPGFESVVTGSNPPIATDWPTTPYATVNNGNIAYVQPATYQNHTPGGGVIEWLQVFQPAGYIDQPITGVSGGSNYTLSGWFYFETSYPTDVDTYMSLNWSDGTSNEFDIVPSVVGTIPTNTWTQYSMTVTAPSAASSVDVRFGFTGGDNVGGQQSAFLDDVDLEGVGAPPAAPQWSQTGSADWNSDSSWNTGSIPNGVGAEADLLGSITANHTAYSDIPITAGILKFNNTHTYVIAGAGSLTLQNTPGNNAQIIVQAGAQEINLPLTLASNTVFTVSSGASLTIADPLTINSGINLTSTGTVTYESTITALNNATIAFGNSSHAHALTLQAGSSASISGTGSVLTLDSLQIASGATLNLGKAEAVVNYTGSTIASSIAGSIKSGQIASSAASFASGTSVGYFDTGSQIEIERTWIGDLNLDGVINSADFNAMGTAGGGWQHGDLNYDGVVNADDYSLFAYGAALAGSKSINNVPEPAALGLGLLAGAFLPRRRRD